MSEPTPSPRSIDSRLEVVLAEYLRTVEMGQTVDRDEFVARYPDLADDLRSFFRNRDAMQKLAEPLQGGGSSGEAPTIGLDGSATGDATRVRYFGDYELQGEIARGGMGVVYRARQVSLNRPVALKMILAAQLASADDVRRFQQEAEAAANLDHPHIVPIYEIGEHEGQHYFSMKLIEGGSLSQRLKANATPLPARETAQLMATVARAVHHAHQRGLLHRDLKPGNILLDAAGQPHVTDFGLAKRVEGDSELTHSGAVVGTPAYMAPEQARAETHLTTSADVYGLGAILYELLVGRPPFRADSTAEMLVHVLNDEPAAPRSVNPRIDRDLETICLKCLEKEPARRYDSAAALAEEIDRWLLGEPIQARPCTVWERVEKWGRRRPAIAGMAAAMLMLCVVAVAGIAWQWRAAVHERTIAEQQREVADQNLYVARMHLARVAWEAADTARLQEFLAHEVPKAGERDHRGWEWHFLRDQSRGLVSLTGHTETISGVAWSPDGALVASVASNSMMTEGELRVWDSLTGQPSPKFGGSMKFGLRTVAWSQDGKRIAAGGGLMAGFRNILPGELRIWDVTSGDELFSLRGHIGHVNSVAWSHDGRRLASGNGEFGSRAEVKIWDATTGKKLFDLNGHQNEVNAVAWSPDDKLLLSVSADGIVKVWDTVKGTEVQTIKAHQHAALLAVWKPDGKQFATTSADMLLKVWDVATWKDVARAPLANTVAISWPREAEQIDLANGYGSIVTWDLPTRKALRTTKLKVHAFFLADWSKERRRIALACGDQSIKLVDFAPIAEATALKAGSTPLTAVAWTRDGRRLATAGADIKLWNSDTCKQDGHQPWPAGWSVINAAWSPDGSRLASSSLKQFSGTIKVWDVVAAKELFVWNAHIGPAFGLAWSPDGALLATGGMDGKVRLWDASVRDREIATLKGHTGQVHSVAWHPLQRWLASAGEDGTVRLWDPSRVENPIVLQGHTGAVQSVSWRADGAQLASGGIDGIKVWDLKTRQAVLSLRGHAGPVTAVAWRPSRDANHQRIASLGTDGMLKVWDLASAQEVLTLKADKTALTAVSWSPDGSRLIAGTRDGTAKIWTASMPAMQADASIALDAPSTEGKN